jgi:hypothetical protein
MAAALNFLPRWPISDRSRIPEIQGPGDLHAAGHRVVHGGETFH